MHTTEYGGSASASAAHRSRGAGFTLIELMIVIAIVGILAAVALPQYNTYTKRSRFAEVVLAVTPYKVPAEVAVQLGRVTDRNQLDATAFGIPENIGAEQSPGKYVAGVTMLDGVITATGTDTVESAVFQLVANITNGGIRWAENAAATNACQLKGLC